MSLIKTKAIVIKSIKWAETSKIVTLYTREYGCIKVIARGSRRIKSEYAGNLEPLNILEALIYVSAKRELQMLGQVSLVNSFPGLRTDLEKMAYALAILELIQIFIHYQEKEQIFFDFVYQLLDDLQKAQKPELVLWYFILKIASYLGFKPEFTICKICNKKVDQDFVLFKINDGTIICNQCELSANNQQNILPRKTVNFLTRLQHTHYKKILEVTYPENNTFNYTKFLLFYLQFHTNQPINLSSLQYFLKNI
jgi:DNA repair protein RecO (recombination protein O)